MNLLKIISLSHLAALLLLLGFSPLNSQSTCNSLSEFAADDCTDACIGCPINGFQGTTTGYSGGGSFCNGALTETNSAWLAFIAGSSTIGFQVTPSNCADGNGIQMAIMPNCSDDALACNTGFANGGSSPQSLTVALTPGQT